MTGSTDGQLTRAFLFADLRSYAAFLAEVKGQVLRVWLAAPEAEWPAFDCAARSLLTSLEIVP